VTEKIEITAPAARIVPGTADAGDVLEDHRQAGALLLRAGELLERLGADAGDGHQHVDRDHDDERAHDRAGQGRLRVL
jgi:hypothetical protein